MSYHYHHHHFFWLYVYVWSRNKTTKKKKKILLSSGSRDIIHFFLNLFCSWQSIQVSNTHTEDRIRQTTNSFKSDLVNEKKRKRKSKIQSNSFTSQVFMCVCVCMYGSGIFNSGEAVRWFKNINNFIECICVCALILRWSLFFLGSDSIKNKNRIFFPSPHRIDRIQ